MLKGAAVIMPDGTKIACPEGNALKGGPGFSPLLFNI